MADAECCHRRSAALAHMLQWFYQDNQGHTYGPVESFKLVYYIYENFFDETTPFLPCAKGQLVHQTFGQLKTMIPLLENDFEEYSKDVFACPHYMETLLQESEEDVVDPDIQCIDESAAEKVAHEDAGDYNVEPDGEHGEAPPPETDGVPVYEADAARLTETDDAYHGLRFHQPTELDAYDYAPPESPIHIPGTVPVIHRAFTVPELPEQYHANGEEAAAAQRTHSAVTDDSLSVVERRSMCYEDLIYQVSSHMSSILGAEPMEPMHLEVFGTKELAKRPECTLPPESQMIIAPVSEALNGIATPTVSRKGDQVAQSRHDTRQDSNSSLGFLGLATHPGPSGRILAEPWLTVKERRSQEMFMDDFDHDVPRPQRVPTKLHQAADSEEPTQLYQPIHKTLSDGSRIFTGYEPAPPPKPLDENAMSLSALLNTSTTAGQQNKAPQIRHYFIQRPNALNAHHMMIKQRMQSNLREARQHLSRVTSRKLSHVFSNNKGYPSFASPLPRF